MGAECVKVKYAIDKTTKEILVYLEHVLSSSDCSDVVAHPTTGNLPEAK